MQILVTNDNVIMFVGTIEKGIYDADPSRELYKITNEQGDFYAVTEGFTPITVDEVPADIVADVPAEDIENVEPVEELPSEDDDDDDPEESTVNEEVLESDVDKGIISE